MSRQAGLFIVALIVIAGAIMGCAGLDFGDLVQVETPIEIQKEKGYPKRMSLNESKQLYASDLEDYKRNFVLWKGNIEDGDALSGMLSQLSLQKLNELGPEIAGVPVLGPVAPFATGLIAWMIQGARMRREKEKSHNHGMMLGADAAARGAREKS